MNKLTSLAIIAVAGIGAYFIVTYPFEAIRENELAANRIVSADGETKIASAYPNGPRAGIVEYTDKAVPLSARPAAVAVRARWSLETDGTRYRLIYPDGSPGWVNYESKKEAERAMAKQIAAEKREAVAVWTPVN